MFGCYILTPSTPMVPCRSVGGSTDGAWVPCRLSPRIRVGPTGVSGKKKREKAGEFESVRAFLEISMLQGEGICIKHINLIKYDIYIECNMFRYVLYFMFKQETYPFSRKPCELKFLRGRGRTTCIYSTASSICNEDDNKGGTEVATT